MVIKEAVYILHFTHFMGILKSLKIVNLHRVNDYVKAQNKRQPTSPNRL